MQHFTEAYLDIETTGLSPTNCDITVIGIYLCNGSDTKFTQLVGKDITMGGISESLVGVSKIHTYNGSRFDLPFIASRVGVDLAQSIEHRDLMYDCWKCNLYGGLKSVEKQLGIQRQLTEMNGYEAVRELRKQGITTPIVALTANAMKDDDKKCFEAGCDDYLAKPIDRRELLKIIGKYLPLKELALIDTDGPTKISRH